MKWRDLSEHTPEIGQYCFVKKGETMCIAIWHKEFIFIGDNSEESKWAPAFLTGNYVDIPGTRGELDFIPTGLYDEDGKEFKIPTPLSKDTQ